MRLYHTTTSHKADKIQGEGFKDGELRTINGKTLRGVWLAFDLDQPGDLTLVLEVPNSVVATWREEHLDEELGHVYVPAARIKGKAEIVDCRPPMELIKAESEQAKED